MCPCDQSDNLIIAIVFKRDDMELVMRLISDTEAAVPAILSLRDNMDAGSDPASETPRKKVTNDGICFLCIKSVKPKWRIKSRERGAWNQAWSTCTGTRTYSSTVFSVLSCTQYLAKIMSTSTRTYSSTEAKSPVLISTL